MKKIATLITILSFFSSSLLAQMWNGVDTLYGNEWINHDQSYFKIMVAEDGLFRISQSALANQGIPVSSIQANEWQLFHMGESQPIYVTTTGSIGPNDYIEFFGKKNRGELDRYLFNDPDAEMANPEYSLFTDSSTYYLTWGNTTATGNFETITNDLNSAPSTPESFCFYNHKEIFTEEFSKDRHPGSIFYANFERAEGFVGGTNLLKTITLTPENMFSSGPASKMKTRVAVTNATDQNPNHIQTVKVDGNLVATDEFSDARVLHNEFELTTSALGSSIDVEFEGTYNDKDWQKVAYVQLKYPRTFDFIGKNYLEFSMPASSGYLFLDILNFEVTGGAPVLYDLTNKKRIEATVTNGKTQIALPPSAIERQLVLANPTSAIQMVSEVKETTFINYKELDGNFIIISNPTLYGGGTDWVEEYAMYRSSPAGRNFNTVVVDVNQLYEQFSYGINRHSISIRNFGHFVTKEWTNPQYFFLIGKGRTYDEIRTETNLNEAIADNTFHIPTFGAGGGGDNQLLSTNDTDFPIASIGRLAAKDANDVKIYLDKVIAQEANQVGPQTIESKAWRKKVLHLGGGNSNEQPIFKGYLDAFEDIIENGKFGGEVTSFYKTSSDPVQISISDQLTGIINEGISVMTIFGHASIAGFDFSIDDASSYDNEGRFPVLISLGCFSGQIHSKFQGVSEDFILEEKKGAIAFLASTGLSFAPSLRKYGNEFYRNLSEDKYGEGIGDISRKALEVSNNQIGYLAGIMTLHGDPSILVKVGEGPDYIVNSNSVQFDPNPISIQLDSFDFSFEVVNLGQRVDGKIEIEVQQELPNGLQLTMISDSIQAPFFRKTFTYRIPILGSQALGANKFYIEIDKGNAIVELPDPVAEENNNLVNSSGAEGLIVHFISNEVIPVFPKEFGIVSNQDVTLKASTSSPFLESQKYIFEIDTTNLFNSPLLERHEVTQMGGVVKWDPTVNYENNTVYYWRVSPEENPDVGGFIWRESSFLYSAGADDGWNQSHFFQFRGNEYFNTELLDGRDFQFIKDFKDVRIEDYAQEPPFNIQTALFISNDFAGQYYGTPEAAIGIVVLEPLNVEPWDNVVPSPYGAIWYGTSRPHFIPFLVNTPEERQNVINFLENEVPDGHFVGFLTMFRKGSTLHPEDWAADSVLYNTNIFSVLESEGATQVRNLEDTGTLPYIFVYEKGGGPITEDLSSTVDDPAISNFGIPGNWDSGHIESTKIGPATSWKSFSWEASSLDNIPTDDYFMEVIGVDVNGKDSLLISDINTTQTLLNSIDAEEFPYLKLRFNTVDTIQKSSAQLDYWRVFYDGVPEVALNPNALFSFDSDTLSQGEKLNMNIAIENIGRYDMDSLLVKFSIIDQSNNQTEILKRVKPLLKGDTLVANLSYDTYNLSNKNTFQVEVNPNMDQIEKFAFNNIGFFDFFVESDQRNPLLDVTFDGFHIMDGDLVSARPGILITLKDENEFLPLDDPAYVKIFLKSPDKPDLRQIFVDGDTLSFSPGTTDNNKSQLLFQPHLLVDGTYFFIVQAEDASGNQSGNLDYKISFEVQNKSMITNVLNYPNPFSTSTRFVFTVTGSELPEDMKIQIMTISGRIIREIRQDELGPLHIGNNITSYAWDGTDEYGARLANGVYLYRIVTRKTNDEDFEHLPTQADQFFKNGFGKMVIMR